MLANLNEYLNDMSVNKNQLQNMRSNHRIQHTFDARSSEVLNVQAFSK
jgi:hypothetical protein